MQVTKKVYDHGKLGQTICIVCEPNTDEAALARRAEAVKQACREIADRGGFNSCATKPLIKR